MSEILTQLEQQEKDELMDFFSKLDLEMLKNVASAISMMVRAFQGQSIEPEDIISRLTNVKNILERSRFPTYPLLAKQVYLRLIAKYNPKAYPCEDWANLEAQALIEYKGLGREEYVEMTKAAATAESQQIYFGDKPKLPESDLKAKKHFWTRGPKPESSEFKHQ